MLWKEGGKSGSHTGRLLAEEDIRMQQKKKIDELDSHGGGHAMVDLQKHRTLLVGLACTFI